MNNYFGRVLGSQRKKKRTLSESIPLLLQFNPNPQTSFPSLPRSKRPRKSLNLFKKNKKAARKLPKNFSIPAKKITLESEVKVNEDRLSDVDFVDEVKSKIGSTQKDEALISLVTTPKEFFARKGLYQDREPQANISFTIAAKYRDQKHRSHSRASVMNSLCRNRKKNKNKGKTAKKLKKFEENSYFQFQSFFQTFQTHLTAKELLAPKKISSNHRKQKVRVSPKDSFAHESLSIESPQKRSKSLNRYPAVSWIKNYVMNESYPIKAKFDPFNLESLFGKGEKNDQQQLNGKNKKQISKRMRRNKKYLKSYLKHQREKNKTEVKVDRKLRINSFYPKIKNQDQTKKLIKRIRIFKGKNRLKLVNDFGSIGGITKGVKNFNQSEIRRQKKLFSIGAIRKKLLSFDGSKKIKFNKNK